MNMFKNLINSLAESSFDKLVLQFVVSKLESDNVWLLLSDANQKVVYDRLLNRLCSVGGAKVGITDMELLSGTIAEELIIVHSVLDVSLLNEVLEKSPQLERVIYIAETSVPDVDEEAINQLSTEFITEIIFAYQDRAVYSEHLKIPDTEGALNLYPEKE